MKNKQNKKGITLIEIVISIAILSIMALAFLTMFSGSFISVFNSGNVSDAMYEAQTNAEEVLDNFVYDSTDSSSVTIIWGSDNLTVQGNIKVIGVDISNDDSGEQAEVTVFIPEEGD